MTDTVEQFEPEAGEFTKACDIIKKARQTHKEWAAYFTKYPEKYALPEFNRLGSVDQHRKYIQDYNYVISVLHRQAERIKELEKQHKKGTAL